MSHTTIKRIILTAGLTILPLSAKDIYLSEASKERPADIKDILERVVMCIHFGGEEPYSIRQTTCFTRCAPSAFGWLGCSAAKLTAHI
ncbi:Uncharacterized protein XB16_1645 [Leptospira santarosai]|uniref:Uncharacterized protein n=1 Tax=Leptospira santarosai TaxID=28183 RepID=A0A2P1QST1_9LEPT|nr:Uncharacterized protein XB16_1645 [Leptospira santarosai]